MEDKHTQTTPRRERWSFMAKQLVWRAFASQFAGLIWCVSVALTSSFCRFVPRPRRYISILPTVSWGLDEPPQQHPMLVSACVYFRPVVGRGSVCAAALIMGSLRACPRHVAEMMCCASGTLWCLSFNRTKAKGILSESGRIISSSSFRAWSPDSPKPHVRYFTLNKGRLITERGPVSAY